MQLKKFSITFVVLLSVVVLAGCTDNPPPATSLEQPVTLPPVAETSTAAIGAESTASTKVDYIEFDAVVLTADNLTKQDNQLNGALAGISLSAKSTTILLTLNNHRDDLTTLDYTALATLDGVAAESWQQTTVAMGGHHVSGILTFASTETPQALTLTDLPVGTAVLRFEATTE